MISTSGVRWRVCFFEPSITKAAAAPKAPNTPKPINAFFIELTEALDPLEDELSDIVHKQRLSQRMKKAIESVPSNQLNWRIFFVYFWPRILTGGKKSRGKRVERNGAEEREKKRERERNAQRERNSQRERRECRHQLSLLFPSICAFNHFALPHPSVIVVLRNLLPIGLFG